MEFSCQNCNYKTTNEANLKRHEALRIKNNRCKQPDFLCNVCQKSFDKKFFLDLTIVFLILFENNYYLKIFRPTNAL